MTGRAVKPTPDANAGLWNVRNIAWLAGLLEGEGCFYSRRRGKDGVALGIALTMTDEDVVRHAATVGGCGIISGPWKSKHAHHKPFWRWTVSRQRDAYAVAVAVYGFLGSRRRSAVRDIIVRYAERARGPWRHGTSNAYVYHGCRCTECRAGVAKEKREYLAARRGVPVPGPRKPWQHGTLQGYRYHRCRCDRCRLANNIKAAKDRARKLRGPQPHPDYSRGLNG